MTNVPLHLLFILCNYKESILAEQDPHVTPLRADLLDLGVSMVLKRERNVNEKSIICDFFKSKFNFFFNLNTQDMQHAENCTEL